MVTFVDMIYLLEEIGVAAVLLPFLLVFTIVFAILRKTEILGEGRQAKRFDAIVSLVMALAVIFPSILGYYPPGLDPVSIINRALPQVAVVIVAVIMLLLMIGAFGAKWKVAETGAGSIVVLLSIITIIYIFGTSAGWWYGGQFPNWLWWLGDPTTQALIITILVFGVIVWLIVREPDEGNSSNDDDGFLQKYFQTEAAKAAAKKK